MRGLLPPSLLIAATSMAVTGCGAGNTASLPTAQVTPQLQQLINGARQEGSLAITFATTGTDDEWPEWTAGFNHYYGLNLNFTLTQNPDMPAVASSMIAEHTSHKAASTDVYFGVAIFIEELEHAGALQRGALAMLPNASPYAEDGGTAVALTTVPTGITYNSNRVRGADIPHTFASLLNEPSTLHIASEPYAGTLAGLPRYWGAGATILYTARLSNHLTGLFGCGEESRLVTGEFDIFAPDCGDNAARRLEAEGAPIGEVLPSDGSFITNTYLAVAADAPHPDAARLWVNYLMSRQAQDVLWKYDFMDSQLVPGSHIAAIIAADERAGVQFHRSTLATVALDAPYQQAQTCIQALLNNQAADPSCDQYRNAIAAAGR